MRPPGEIRQAAMAAAWETVRQHQRPHVTVHDLVARLVPQGVSQQAVRHTFDNLVRAGALSPRGTVRVPGVSRPLRACVPVEAPADAPSMGTALADATRGWGRLSLAR